MKATRSHSTAALLAALGLACSDGDPGSDDRLRQFAEGRFPVPGCENHDYGPCDIREPGCQLNLFEIAHCLRGAGSTSPSDVPPIELWSETRAREDWLASLSLDPHPDPDHFERALVLFGLASPGSLEPAEMAARLARDVAAFYHYERQSIVIIDRPGAGEPPLPDDDPESRSRLGDDASLLHELVHALQDRDHDLSAFSRRFRVGFDGNLRGASVIEGEALLHQQRYVASRAGLDPSQIDLELAFDNLVTLSEASLMSEPDLYARSESIVPYAHGGRFVHSVHRDGGQDAVRALFDAPPAWTQPVLATAWGGVVADRVREFAEPAPPDDVDVRLAAYTSMGAWGVYLLARATMTDTERAQRLALAWRGDQLRAYAWGVTDTAGVWEIELAGPGEALELSQTVAREGIQSAVDDRLVTFLVSTAAPPDDPFGD